MERTQRLRYSSSGENKPALVWDYPIPGGSKAGDVVPMRDWAICETEVSRVQTEWSPEHFDWDVIEDLGIS